MKWIDRWIRAQFAKRFPDDFHKIMAQPQIIIRREEIEIAELRQSIGINNELDFVMPAELKAQELVRGMIPHLIENMEIKREENPLLHEVVYTGKIKVIPAQKNVISEQKRREQLFADWMKGEKDV